MSAAATVRKTEKKMACQLETGDVFVAGLLDENPYRVTVYTITQVYPCRWDDESVTIECAYQYGGRDGAGTRTIWLPRMDFVTVV